jgi:hypothetical protein
MVHAMEFGGGSGGTELGQRVEKRKEEEGHF